MTYEELPTDQQVKDADDMWGVAGFEVSELVNNAGQREDDAKTNGSTA